MADQVELPIFENIFVERLNQTINGLPEHTADTHFIAIQKQTAESLLNHPIETAQALAGFVLDQSRNPDLSGELRSFYESLHLHSTELIHDNDSTQRGIVKGLKSALNLGEAKG